MKGVRVDVYRHADGTYCDKSRISNRFAQFVVVAPGILPELVESSDDMPALLLVKHPAKHMFPDHWVARPVEKGHWEFGGNFLYGSPDGHFGAITHYHPVPIHDQPFIEDNY